MLAQLAALLLGVARFHAARRIYLRAAAQHWLSLVIYVFNAAIITTWPFYCRI